MLLSFSLSYLACWLLEEEVTQIPYKRTVAILTGDGKRGRLSFLLSLSELREPAMRWKNGRLSI
jgi:hypothetical protein